jgi:RNA polymerase sigma-70 factor (ECF subfamily)
MMPPTGTSTHRREKIVTGSDNVPDEAAPGRSMTTGLLIALQGQDADAWRHLVHLYGPVVYGWCKRQGLQATDAEDVSQEVFRTVLARIADFRRGRPGDTFRGWLWTITRNKLGDHLRRRAAQPQAAGGSEAHDRLQQLPTDEASTTVGPEPAGDLYRRALELIRSEFEETTWQAFWRVVGEGRRPADVAAELGLSLNAVYLAKSRALRRLREALGDV